MEVDDARLKELKITIPTELHLQLMRLKILHGQTIASTVEEALRMYFAHQEAARTPQEPRPQ